MNKRKTQSVRIHSLQWWSGKIAGAKLNCSVPELIRRVVARDKEALDVWANEDEECRRKDAATK